MKTIFVAGVLILLLSFGYLVEAHSFNKNHITTVYSPFYAHYLEKLNKKPVVYCQIDKVIEEKSCQKMETSGEASHERKEIKGSIIHDYIYNWTFMIYIDGDNDLATYAEKEIEKLRQINSSGIVIVALYDGNKYNDSCLYVIFSGKITKINKGELNMGSGKTLKDFIEYSKNYSAKHYLLEIWGHGDGWMGVSFDKNSKDYLSLKEIKEALSNESVDVIVFSACYMGSIEVAYELKDKASYFIAPEGIMLASGLPYEKIFKEFNASMDCESVTKLIVKEYGKYYAHTSTNFAAWNLSKMDDLVQSIGNFSASLNKSMVEMARNATAIDSKFVDLYEFAKFFGEEKIMKAIDETVVSKFGSLHGIEIYCPLPQYYSSEYSSLSFPIATHWDEIL